MELLPLESQEEILLRSSGRNLVNLCQSSLTLRSLCSKDSFWFNKFRQEGLPLLERPAPQETNLAGAWSTIYLKSLRSDAQAQEYLRKVLPEKGTVSGVADYQSLIGYKIVSININDRSLLPLLSIGKISLPALQDLFDAQGQGRDLQSSPGYDLFAREGQLPWLSSVEARLYDINYFQLQIDSREITPLQITNLTVFKEANMIVYQLSATTTLVRLNREKLVQTLQLAISPEDLNYLIYRLFYFGILKVRKPEEA